jgi:flagellar hook-basal body complex protein FliE
MLDRLNNFSIPTPGTGGSTSAPSTGATGEAPKTSFADVLKSQINEVAALQQDASSAVQQLATGQTDDVTGVFVAMEKSETAFKTLLAIRSKLLDAYEEIKNLPI